MIKKYILSPKISILLLAILTVLSTYFMVPVLYSHGPTELLVLAAKSFISEEKLGGRWIYEHQAAVINSAIYSANTKWQDIFVVLKDGSLFPKHGHLMSILLAPFIFLLGETAGIIVFQVAIISCLLDSIWILAKTIFNSSLSPLLTFIITCLSTQLYATIGSISIDLFVATLFVAGLSLSLRSYPIMGAFLFTLPIFLRASNIIQSFFIAFILITLISSNKKRLLILIGGVACLACYLLQNYYLFGSAYITQHDRMPYINANGIGEMMGGVKSFSWHSFSLNWLPALIDTLLFNPVIIFCFISLFYFKEKPARYFTLAALTGVITQFIFYASYDVGMAKGPGNRYLIGAILICSIPVLGLFDQIIKNSKKIYILENTPN